MKRKLFLIPGCLALLAGQILAAELSTAISYQGILTDNGTPANGTHSFRFRLLADDVGNTQVGPTLDFPSHQVAQGLFGASLDFGEGAFNGDARWLEISVKPGNPSDAGEYIQLNPQPLPPAPASQFARIAGDVLNGAITGSKLAPLAVTTTHISDGAITGAKLGPASVTSGNVEDNAITAAKIATGQVVKSLNVKGNLLRDNVTLAEGPNITLTPNGSTVTIASSGSGGAGPWATLNGNAYYEGGYVGIGTDSPIGSLDVRSGTDSFLRIDPTYGDLHFNGGGDGVFGLINEGGASGRTEFHGNNISLVSIMNSGNVGIGTTAPGFKLDVVSDNSSAIVGRSSANSGVGVYGESSQYNGVRGVANHVDHGAVVGVHNNGGWGVFGLSSGNGVVGESSAGGVGVFGRSTEFEGVRGEALNIDHGAIVGVHNGGGWGMYGLSSGNGVVGESLAGGVGVFGRSSTWEGVHGECNSTTAAAVAGINLNTGAGVYGESRGGGYGGYFIGRVRVGVLEIAGGADLAEPFPMKEEAIEKGSVVVIDDEHPGRLKRSTHAYDTRVAGIVSGANGIHPGIALKQEDALDHGENVALTGRVYVQADASFGTIRPGDLLTTSDTPGHAMKVTDSVRAQGAILGKAMTALNDGQGLVLVLVTLQ